ncbi:MAG: DUF4351 domain-containing protein [Bacillota bacterium]|nr:DUF4351 domain-containing protein [Bacillota bacterium]
MEALRSMILKQARKKFNGIAPQTETKIKEINNPELLEKIVENILDIQSEDELLALINS